MGGRDGSSCLKTVECFDPHTNKWLHCSPMSKRRGGVGVATCNGFLYAVGGHEAPASNPSCCRFDCAERYSIFFISFEIHLIHVTDAIFHDSVKMCIPQECILNSVNPLNRYDPKTDQWTMIANISSPRDAVGVCILGERVFAVGGYDGQHYLQDVESYDPVTNEWSKVSVCMKFVMWCVDV